MHDRLCISTLRLGLAAERRPFLGKQAPLLEAVVPEMFGRFAKIQSKWAAVIPR